MTQTVESSFHIITIHKHSIAGQVENIPPVSRTKSIEKNRDHLLICHFYSHIQTQENKKDPLHRASNTTTMNHQSRKGTDIIHSFIHSYIHTYIHTVTFLCRHQKDTSICPLFVHDPVPTVSAPDWITGLDFVFSVALCKHAQHK